MRLNRFLAAAGEGSRRSCEALIQGGNVTLNGVVVTDLATRVGPEDVVKLGNRVLHAAASSTLVLHKPPGYLCTASDTHGRRTIFDLLPPNHQRVFHVGRLDKESEGLLILTNDGDLSLKLTHPRYKVDKEYEVVLDQTFDFEQSAKLLRGITLEEGWAKAEAVHRLARNKLKVVLRQGMKRQIRLMFHHLGYEVVKLTRTRIGPVRLENLPPGAWRVLTREEIAELVAAGKVAAAARPKPTGKPRSKPDSKSTAKPERSPTSKPPAARKGRPVGPDGPRSASGPRRAGGPRSANRPSGPGGPRGAQRRSPSSRPRKG